MSVNYCFKSQALYAVTGLTVIVLVNFMSHFFVIKDPTHIHITEIPYACFALLVQYTRYLHASERKIQVMLNRLSPKHTVFNPIALLGSGFNETVGIKELSICVLTWFCSVKS